MRPARQRLRVRDSNGHKAPNVLHVVVDPRFYRPAEVDLLIGFTQAIDKMKPRSSSQANAYENRADAYSHSQRYLEAAGDLTKAITYQISASLWLMSLKQFRIIFPEYA